MTDDRVLALTFQVDTTGGTAPTLASACSNFNVTYPKNSALGHTAFSCSAASNSEGTAETLMVFALLKGEQSAVLNVPGNKPITITIPN